MTFVYRILSTHLHLKQGKIIYNPLSSHQNLFVFVSYLVFIIKTRIDFTA